MTYYDKYRYLTMLDAVEEEDNWWGVGYELNGIFKVRKKDNKVSLIKKIMPSECEVARFGRYKYTYMYKNKIFFLPWMSRNIEVYDIESKMSAVIEIPGDITKIYNAIGYLIEGEYIYLFSCYRNEAPVRINMQTMVCEQICKEWLDNADRYAKHEKEFIRNICRVDNDIWYGVYDTNMLIKASFLDMQNIEKIHLEENYKIYGVEYIGNNKLFIITTVGVEYLIYNIADGIIESKISVDQIGKVTNILKYGEEIVLVPSYGRKLMIVNTITGINRIIECDDKRLKCFADNDSCFFGGKMDNDKIYLYPYKTNMYVIINREDMSVSYEEWKIDESISIEEIMKKYVIDFDELIHTEERCNLDIFLDDIMSYGRRIQINGDVGDRVHEEITKQMQK